MPKKLSTWYSFQKANHEGEIKIIPVVASGSKTFGFEEIVTWVGSLQKAQPPKMGSLVFLFQWRCSGRVGQKRVENGEQRRTDKFIGAW